MDGSVMQFGQEFFSKATYVIECGYNIGTSSTKLWPNFIANGTTHACYKSWVDFHCCVIFTSVNKNRGII